MDIGRRRRDNDVRKSDVWVPGTDIDVPRSDHGVPGADYDMPGVDRISLDLPPALRENGTVLRNPNHVLPVMSQPSATPVTAAIRLDHLIIVIGSDVRWRVLALLSDGEPWSTSEIADRVGITHNAMSKHIRILLELRMIRKSNSRLYRLESHIPLLPDRSGIDFGHCLMRFYVVDP